MAQGRGGPGATRGRRDRRLAGRGQAVEHVRPGGADVLSVRARRQGQGPSPQPHHRRAHGPLRRGPPRQLQGQDAPLRPPRQPGVGPGVRLLQVPRPVQRPGGLPQGPRDAGPRRLRRQGHLRPGRGAHAGAPRQPAGPAVVPPGGAARGRGQGARGADAGRLDRDAGRRGVPGGVALRRRGRARGGRRQRALQGLRVAQALVPPRERDRGAGRAAAGAGARAGGIREGAGGQPDPQDVGGGAHAHAEPAVERGPGLRRRRAVRGAAGADGGGPGVPAQGRPAGPRRAAAHALRQAPGPPPLRAVPLVRPREVRRRGGHRGRDAAGAPLRQPRPRARLPRGRLPRHGRVHHVHQRHPPHGAPAVEAARRRARDRHPRRGRAAAHEDPRRPRHHRRVLRRQVRPEVGAHPHHDRQLRPHVERAVHVGSVRPLHRHHHRRLRQLPPRRRQQRRRRAAGEGRPHRQDPHPAVDAGDRPRVHARVPADRAAAVRGEEDGGAPSGRALHLPVAHEHGAPVHAAAAPPDALPAPVHGDAAGRAAVPGDGHRGGAAGARGAAAAPGGGGVHAGRGVAHVEHAAEQGQLLPRRVALLGRRRRRAVVRRRVPLEERGDDGAGARAAAHPGVVPGADPPHRVPLHVPHRALELPAPAAPPAAHGHQDVVGGGGAPGRAGRGVRHVPDVAAAGRGVHAVRPAAERCREDTDGGRRHGHAGGAPAVAARLARPEGDVPLRRVLPPRGGGALRHAVPHRGARRGALRPAPPQVPEQAAFRAQQLLPPPAVARGQHALNPRSRIECYGFTNHNALFFSRECLLRFPFYILSLNVRVCC
uniref:Uncharacterized protein n=1 Tax=Zea mays TaxID=4577 RepID=A0A804PWQ6_MAIZE|eukprot:XP_008649063.1 collagen alpha-1(I) chain isoform X1 [Zea mays]